MLIKHSAVAGAILFAASQSADAITINFDYSYDGGFFSGTNLSHRSTLEAAGNVFDSLLTDNLTAITSDSFNHFNARFNRPDTGSLTTLTDYNVASNALTVFVGGRALGGTTLGQGGPGGYSASGTADFLTTIAQRGQSGITSGTAATDFAPWGGQLVFDTTSNWYFDNDTSTTESFSGQSDFYSVALHEIAHLLGFGTADSWSNLSTLVAGNSFFTGANAKAAYGGNVPLSPGHWQEGTQSATLAGVSQEALMDPSLTEGTRKILTRLDIAGLKDVGWQVAPVPLPSAAWLFGSVLLGLAGYTRKKAIKA